MNLLKIFFSISNNVDEQTIKLYKTVKAISALMI